VIDPGAFDRQAQGALELAGDLAGDADDRGAVGPVRGQVDLDHRVLQAHGGDEGPTVGRALRQFHDPGMGVAQRQLTLGAEHAAGLDSADLGLLDLHLSGQGRAGQGDDGVESGAGIGGAADDLEDVVADRHLAQGQLVGVRVRLRRDDPGGLQRSQFLMQRGDGVDLQPQHGQVVGQLIGSVALGVYILIQPVKRELHGSCRVIRKAR